MPRPSIIVYVICHDDDSQAKAEVVKQLYFPKCGVIFRIPRSTVYFENELFSHLMENCGEWQNADYVGQVTYRFMEKVYSPVPNIEQEIQKNPKGDIFTLYNIDFWSYNKNYNTRCRLHVLNHARFNHGYRFIQAWNMLTSTIDTYENYTTNPMGLYEGFFCNFWVAKVEWMKKYINVFDKVKSIMQNDKALKDIINSDSQYKGNMDPNKLKAITGYPFYTLHAFILERFPIWYFKTRSANIVRLGRILPNYVP